MLRVGLGYDIHRLVPGRPLVIGGVEIPFEKGFQAYSDGDVVAHALVDALLGAVSPGEDIADRFPDTDPQNKDIRSILYLVRLRPLLEEKVASVLNLDVVIEADRPRLKPHFPQMRHNIAQALGISLAQVGIKGKTSDGLGMMMEAIAARAIVLLDSSRPS